MKIYPSLLILSLFAISACQNQVDSNNDNARVITPVTVVHPENTTLNEEITLNATSIYLLKNFLKANINGYIISSRVKLGQYVKKGEVLFVLKTKEAQNLGNTINHLDSTFHFMGLNQIKSPVSGYITQLNHQTGDYVQDGEQLVELTDKNSFGFIMNLPYEDHLLIQNSKQVKINLPDGRTLDGIITQIMPNLDSVSQTQKVLIKIHPDFNIPENLIANVSLVKATSTKFSLPSACILTDESQSSFWIMKLINDSTAVKIPVKKGIETNDRIEIKVPNLALTDRILVTGNYGLADTALVRINK